MPELPHALILATLCLMPPMAGILPAQRVRLPADPRPDAPVSFGYNCAWVAIQTSSSDAVVKALGLRNGSPSTWAGGVKSAYSGRVFVTPPIRGWVLAVSFALGEEAGDSRHPDGITPLLERLGREFPDVQYFATHHVVEFHAWARVRDGKLIRRFSYLGEQGVFIWNDGGLTPEETRLHLVYAEAGPWPDETNVMSLAGAWSVDPSTLAQQHLPPSLGVLADLPR
jgi:hypothetical protein